MSGFMTLSPVANYEFACAHGPLSEVKDLVVEVGVNWQTEDTGMTGLMLSSIWKKSLPVFHFLLSLLDIDVNLSDNKGFTALNPC